MKWIKWMCFLVKYQNCRVISDNKIIQMFTWYFKPKQIYRENVWMIHWAVGKIWDVVLNNVWYLPEKSAIHSAQSDENSSFGCGFPYYLSPIPRGPHSALTCHHANQLPHTNGSHALRHILCKQTQGTAMWPATHKHIHLCFRYLILPETYWWGCPIAGVTV